MAAERAATPRRLSPTAKGKLRKPLALEHVSERRTEDGKKVFRYLAGWRAIQLANDIFGSDRWGAEVVGEVAFRPLPKIPAARGKPAPLGIYTATVRVTVDGCPPHSDVGTSVVTGPTPDHHETAYKGAVTDGLKRALRHFGAGLGNELYAGDEAEDADVIADLQREVIAIGERGGSDEEHTRDWIAKRYGCPLDLLDHVRLEDAVAFLSRGIDRRNGDRQAA